MTLLYVALGGLLGTIARWFLSGAIPPGEGSFPRGTLAVNLLGSLALGFVMRYGTESLQWTPAVRAGLTIGFCGAFTTMSTFAYEAVQLGAAGQWLRTGSYLMLTVAGCYLAIIAGSALAGRLL